MRQKNTDDKAFLEHNIILNLVADRHPFRCLEARCCEYREKAGPIPSSTILPQYIPSCFLYEWGAAIEAVTMGGRGTSIAGAADLHEFLDIDRLAAHLFNALAVEINTFITNVDTTRPCCESADLVLALPTEGAMRDGVAFLVVVPHRSLSSSSV